MAIDNFKVGIRLFMHGNAAGYVAALSKQLLGVNVQVDQLSKKIKFGLAGAIAGIAGEKTLVGLAKMVKYGDQLVHQQQLMRIAGLSNSQVMQATADAYRVSAQVATTTAADNLKHLRELRYALGSLGAAEKFLPQVARSNSILQSVAGNPAVDQVWDFVKSLEMKGVTVNPKTLSSYLNDMTKVVEATGGRVNPTQFFQAFRYGRTAMQGWDQSFIAGALPRLIQSMGGSGAGGRGGPGNALMSAFASVVQGQMTHRAADTFKSLGLGHVTHIPGSSQSLTDIAGKGLFERDPYEWVQKFLMPALTGRGFKSQNDIVGEIARLFPNRTAGQVITEMALQGRFREGTSSQFEKDIKKQQQALAAVPSFQQLMRSDPTTVMAAFNAQWTNMMQALGSVLVPPAIKIMQRITSVFTAIAQAAAAHPDAIKTLLEGIGALGVGLIVFGSAAMIAAIGTLVGLPVILGAAALGVAGALGALAALNWDLLRDDLAAFTSQFKALANVLKHPFSPWAWEGKSGPGGKFLNPEIGKTQTWKQYFENLTKSLDKLNDTLTGNGNPGFQPGAYYGGASYIPALFTSGPGSGLSRRIGAVNPGAAGPISANPAGGTGGMHVNFMHGQFGAPGQNLTSVTAGGKTFRVNAASAPYLSGFVGDLAAAGAPINSVGGFSNRNIAGTGHISQHAYGNAIDIDQHARNIVDPGLRAWVQKNPQKYRALLSKWGIVSGGDWRHPDFGHFEWGGPGGKGGAGSLPGMPTSNSYIANQRSNFAKELSDPNKRLQFAAMLLSEGNPLQTAESAMNRSSFQHKSLMQALRSGFFGPINRGKLPGFMARLQRSPKLMAQMNAAIATALAGSDTIKGSTDQGMVSDPNGRYILNHFHIWGKGHGNIYGDWNAGHGTKSWREQFEHGANDSPAIPPHQTPKVEVHVPVHLDGRQIAKSTAKHFVKQGQLPSSGTRLPDYQGTRMYSI